MEKLYRKPTKTEPFFFKYDPTVGFIISYHNHVINIFVKRHGQSYREALSLTTHRKLSRRELYQWTSRQLGRAGLKRPKLYQVIVHARAKRSCVHAQATLYIVMWKVIKRSGRGEPRHTSKKIAIYLCTCANKSIMSECTHSCSATTAPSLSGFHALRVGRAEYCNCDVSLQTHFTC